MGTDIFYGDCYQAGPLGRLRILMNSIGSAREAITAAGFAIVGETDSAVAGPKGNVERFVHARRVLRDRGTAT